MEECEETANSRPRVCSSRRADTPLDHADGAREEIARGVRSRDRAPECGAEPTREPRVLLHTLREAGSAPAMEPSKRQRHQMRKYVTERKVEGAANATINAS